MRLIEYRTVLPLSLDEFQIGNMYTVARVSRENTGGGEGVELLAYEPFLNRSDLFPNCSNSSGMYSHKVYKLNSKMPWWVKRLVPKSKTELHHEVWNAFPYMKSIMQNDEVLSKEKFFVRVESFFASDAGKLENAFNLPPDLLATREVVKSDFAYDPINPKDYKDYEDPTKFLSKKTGRGMLKPDWKETSQPIMCMYKLVTISVKWFGLQRKLEAIAHDIAKRSLVVMDRRMYCWMDEWIDLTYEEAKKIHQDLAAELKLKIVRDPVVGDKYDEHIKL